MDPIDTWLSLNGNPLADPLHGMAEAGLLAPAPDYATIARMKARIAERTGLLGLSSVWGGRQLVFRHFLSFGTAGQRAAWAERNLAVAISEPGVGAHPKHLTTRAERAAGGVRIIGRKAWVTNGPIADAIIVIAISREEGGRKRYSAFIVPRDMPGLAMQDMEEFAALRPSRHCLLTLDCLVPESALLGEPDTAYERMALPFRDIEDSVGTFATLGAILHAMHSLGAAEAAVKGEIVALAAVYEVAANALVAALDAGRPEPALLSGLRVLASGLVSRLRALAPALPVLADLDATLSVARGPRQARLARLGQTVP
jgi:acyl-CoA dehydrogenase